MVRYSGFLFIISLVFLSGIPDEIFAESGKNILLEKLQRKIISPDMRQQAEFAGKERALICSYCHGMDGNSVKPEVPNLAGQNPGYLLQQIGHFVSGVRKDYVMNSLASKFTEDDQINLAIYYSAKKVKPEAYDQKLAEQGRSLYRQACQACHGKNGMGNTGYARLAGQKQAYIKKTLLRFRSNALSNNISRKRSSPVMEPIASRLSDIDIKHLASYVASMR